MDRFGIIGAAWRRITTRGLEKFFLPVEEQEESLPRLRQALGVDELLYISTCNRVEILFARYPAPDQPSLEELRLRAFKELVGSEPEVGEAARCLNVWAGEGALEHLLMVACGLDSAQLGEREIRGQLKQSHQRAAELGLSGPLLDWALERALRLARDIDHQTELSSGRVSLAGIGLEAVQSHLLEQPGTVSIVGVSAMTERCVKSLVAEGISCLVVNRGEQRGRAMAKRFGVPYRSLERFQQTPDACTAVVTATGAAQPIFGESELRRMIDAAGQPPLIVDFGLPSDADADAATALGVPHLDMEAISGIAEGSKSRRKADTALARELIDRALVDLRRQAAERALAPVVTRLADRYRETADDGVKRLFRRQLRHLGDEERQVLEDFARGLAKRFAHVPIVGLRALAGDHGLETVDTYLAASDDEQAWGLRPDDEGASTETSDPARENLGDSP